MSWTRKSGGGVLVGAAIVACSLSREETTAFTPERDAIGIDRVTGAWQSADMVLTICPDGSQAFCPTVECKGLACHEMRAASAPESLVLKNTGTGDSCDGCYGCECWSVLAGFVVKVSAVDRRGGVATFTGTAQARDPRGDTSGVIELHLRRTDAAQNISGVTSGSAILLTAGPREPVDASGDPHPIDFVVAQPLVVAPDAGDAGPRPASIPGDARLVRIKTAAEACLP